MGRIKVLKNKMVPHNTVGRRKLFYWEGGGGGGAKRGGPLFDQGQKNFKNTG